MLRALLANEASRRPVRSSFARSATPAPNVPRPTEYPSKEAITSPFAWLSSETRLASRADTTGGTARRSFLRAVSRARKAGRPLGVRVKRVELMFRQWPVPHPELYRNVIKTARREASVKMPQSRNDHSDDRNVDVGASLIENEEVEALSLSETHAGG